MERADQGFFCIEWDDASPFVIYGREFDENYQRLEAIMTPCNYIHDKLGASDEVLDRCV